MAEKQKADPQTEEQPKAARLEARVGSEWYPAEETPEVWGIPATPPNKHLSVHLPNGQTDVRSHVHPEDYRDA